MSGDTIDIMLASDLRGAEGLTVAAFSAIRSTRRPVRVWIMEDWIPEPVQARMDAALRVLPNHAGGGFGSLHRMPLALPSWWKRDEWPMSSCARFAAAEILPPDATRCVYLDYDVLVGTDIGALFDIDMGGMLVGMVPNWTSDERVLAYIRSLGLDPARYCNAGVMLIDVAAWRRGGIGPKLIEHGKKMPPRCWFFDQDMLNSFFRDRTLILDDRWNLRDAGADPGGNIIHFAGSGKPWSDDPGLAGLPAVEAWRRLRGEIAFEAETAVRRRSLGERLWTWRAKAQRHALELARGQRGLHP